MKTAKTLKEAYTLLLSNEKIKLIYKDKEVEITKYQEAQHILCFGMLKNYVNEQLQDTKKQ